MTTRVRDKEMIRGKLKNDFSLYYAIPLVLITFGVVLYCQYPSLKDKLLYHCDINLYFPPIYSLKDPAFFANDYLTRYLLFQIPKGYLGLFLLLSSFFDLILLTKTIPFILSIISVVYLFLFGREIKDNAAGFVMSFLFILHSWTYHTFQGTTPRAFLYPLFLPFIYYLLKKKYLICFLLFLAQVLFYPPAAIISLAILFFLGFSIKRNKVYIKPYLGILFLFILTFLLLYFLQFPIMTQKQFGPVISLQDMRNMREFYPGGKEPVFLKSLLRFLESPRVGIDLNSSSIFLLVFSATLFLLFKIINKKKLYIPEEISSIIISGFALYLFSYILILHLYFPARYIMYTLPLFLCIMAGILFSSLLGNVQKNYCKVIILIVFSVLTTFFYIPKINGRLSHYQYLRDALNFLSTTPKNSTIASTPSISDPIPTFAKRKILFSRRLLIPFQKRYYAAVKERVFDFYRAYYADSAETIENFCSKYSVDYIVINKTHFSKSYLEEGPKEDEPFKTYLIGLTKGRNNFILPKMEKNRIAFEKDDIVIVKTMDFR